MKSVVPLSAQSLGGQTRTYSAINTSYIQTTTGGGIIVNPPTTTGPGIDVELKPQYTNYAGSLHIALESNMALTSITSAGEVTNELVDTPGVVAIYDSKHFTFEFTAKNINPDSIKGNSYFTFKIPGWLLTNEVDLEAKVFIEHDTVSQPILSVDSTASSGAKMVTLACDTKYSRIRYTLDGSDVTLGSPLYDGTPITINSSDTLKAVAFVGTMPSEQIEATYNNLPSGEDSNPGEDSGSNSDSNSGGNSNSDENNDSSVGTDSTTEDSDQTTSATTNPSTGSNSISDTVSNTVTTLIQQKERNLTTNATEVQYGLTINNQKVDLENKLLVSNGRTLAPLRTIAKALNIPIHYHAASKTAIIQTEDKLIEFPLGYNVAIVNGEMIQIDANDPTVLSTIQDGRTYLPVRFIAEQLNLNIHFDGEQLHMSSVK